MDTIKKIIIVEDNKDFLWLLKQMFENQPFSSFYAENGEDGLALAEKENPDLMLIDIMMPKMNGIEMARKIKEKGLKPQMIFLTNLNDAEHISEAMDTDGETDYIVKSDIHLDAVLERVKKKLGI